MCVNANDPLLIGISSCLLGERVRYDGGHKLDAFVSQTLQPFAQFKSFCPEMAIGLGVPREPIRLVINSQHEFYPNELRVLATRNPELDFTDELRECARSQQDWLQQLDAYIFKKDSPSCGVQRVKVFKDGHPGREGGTGIFADTVMRNNPLLPVEEEGRLNDARLRENFIQRLYVYREWKALRRGGLSAGKLVQFHSRLKYVLMSRSQTLYRELGRKMANIPADLQPFAEDYIAATMSGLKKVSSRKNHVNVLQHLQGYLKTKLDGDDKQALAKLIHDYREQKIPLIVPITLLRHYFRKHSDDYIAKSWYLNLYPDELALLNNI
jgi:uncharacterized protein YbgA (DUF1722 family)/uncharacterized protein YbbK (DUF523 family)